MHSFLAVHIHARTTTTTVHHRIHSFAPASSSENSISNTITTSTTPPLRIRTLHCSRAARQPDRTCARSLYRRIARYNPSIDCGLPLTVMCSYVHWPSRPAVGHGEAGCICTTTRRSMYSICIYRVHSGSSSFWPKGGRSP